MKITIIQFIVIIISLSICQAWSSVVNDSSPVIAGTFDRPPGLVLHSEARSGSVKAKLLNTNCLKNANQTEKYENSEHVTTRLKLLISTEGVVKEAQLLSSSGDKNIDAEAKKILSSCLFIPSRHIKLDGSEEAFEGWLEFPYTFYFEKNGLKNRKT